MISRRTASVLVLAALVLAACGGTSFPGSGATRIPASPSPSTGPRLAPSELHDVNPPPARNGAALAFDPVSKTLILFGGATVSDQSHPPDAARLGDTWAWDGRTWQQLHPATAAPALYGARLLPEPASGRLLLLAGAGVADASGVLQQEGTWTWDGQTWSRSGDNPLQMPFAAAAVDPTHRQLLLSGIDRSYPTLCGGIVTGACPVLGPIDKPGAYVWNGTRWSGAGGQAPQWSNAGTAYDPLSQQVISAAGSAQNGLQSTYGWDGKQWRLLSQSQGSNGLPDPDYPSPPCEAATDSGAGSLVMVCSFTANGRYTGATWTFDGAVWTRAAQATTTLPSIQSLSLAYDPTVGAVVMVYPGAAGGEAMRLWNGSDWAAIAS